MIIGADENIRKFAAGEIVNSTDMFSEGAKTRLVLARTATRYILQHEDEYIKRCVLTLDYNVKMIRTCISKLETVKPGDRDDPLELTSNLLVAIFHMIYEKALATGEWETLSEYPVLEFMIDNDIDHTVLEKRQIPLWAFGFQKDFMQLMFNNKIQEFSNVAQKIEDLNEEYEEKAGRMHRIVTDWDDKLNGHRESVERMTSQYNFFGLAKAFKDLIDGKRRESKWTLAWLILAAIGVLLPLAASIFVSYLIWADANAGTDPMKNKLLLGLPVLIPLEMVLIYFFRIILRNQLSLKAQILQLELRYSVCAFIEEYSEFAKEIPKEKLEKFEALIFSGITPDPAAVPGTFDGMEQLAGLVQKFQK